jgi:hypothetical protein
MEDRLDNIDTIFEAQREVDDALAQGGHSGLSRNEIEVEFAKLERGNAPVSSERSPDDLDQELTALKRKYRV